MSIKVKVRAKTKPKSLSSKDRWNDRLTIPETKREAKRIYEIYGTDSASAEACGLAAVSAFWNWRKGLRRAPVGIRKVK